MKKSRPVVLAITSDLHAGSTVALCPPEIELDDGGVYKASKVQQWMWQSWGKFWKEVDERRHALDADLYQLFNGDMVDGNHHGTTQIVTGNNNGQAAVVNECLRVPLALSPEKIWIIRGTDVHVGQSGCTEERIADGLRRDKRPIVREALAGTSSHWHARTEIHGWRFDFAHHGRVGTRTWTKPNVTMNLAADIFAQHAQEDFDANRLPTAPHIAIRSHMHQFVDTGKAHRTRVIQTPAWQLATSFIHRIAAGSVGEVGGIIVTIEPGKPPVVDPILFKAQPTPMT
jgi:hypothetical protein